MLVVSYNPGYQNILKSLKPSTRQRFVALEFDFPPPEQEIGIVHQETGLRKDMCKTLVRLAGRFRSLKGQDIDEGVSTRLLIYCASLIESGMALEQAINVSMIEPLTDDSDVKQGLMDIVRVVMG